VFHAELAGKVAGRDLAVAVHQHNQTLFVLVNQHDGFHDLVFVDAEALGGMRRAAVLFIGILHGSVLDFMRAQKTDGGRNGMVGFAHERLPENDVLA